MATSLRIAHVELEGELDLSAWETIVSKLRTAENADIAVVDLSSVTYLDSTALFCLITLKKRMMEAGRAGIVELKAATPRVRRILELCSLEKLFVIK